MRIPIVIALLTAMLVLPGASFAHTDADPKIIIQTLEDFENDRIVDTQIKFNIIATDEGFRAGLRNIRVFEDGHFKDMKDCKLSLKCEFGIISGHTEKGTHQYTFSAEDFGQNVKTKTLSVRFRGLEQAPEFETTNKFNTEEGQQITIPIAARDINNDPLIIKATRLPKGATFVNNEFRWTPSFTDDGTHTAIFEVTDSKGGKDTLSIRITVYDRNRDPAITSFEPDGPIVIAEGTKKTFRADATDPDSDDRLTFRWKVDGKIESRGKGFTYEPDFDDAGEHSIVLEVDDGDVVVRRSRTITVRDYNRAPVIKEIKNREVEAGKTISFSAHATDNDRKDTLVHTAENLPAGARFNNHTGFFSWRTQKNQTGVYDVVFRSYDNKGLSDTETVRIRVNRPDVDDAEHEEYHEAIRRAEDNRRKMERRLSATDGSGVTSTQTTGAQQQTLQLVSSLVCPPDGLCYRIYYVQRL